MKNAIITGASRGIGEAMALRLGQMGYNVVINYRSNSSRELAETLAARLKEEHGVEAIAVQADVLRYEDCEKLVQAAVDAFGEKIDVLVNNAGMNSRSPFCELAREKYTAVLETNLLSAFHMCHFVVPYMVKANGGCVINTSSVRGLMGSAQQADYCASKAGLIGMTRALALEFAKQNIRFNCICPGMIATDMLRGGDPKAIAEQVEAVPLGRVGSVEDIADTMEFLIHNQYMTGQYISPNGGNYMP